MDEVNTVARLKEVLALFLFQFSVQHTVVNDGAYNQAAFVPNASTLMNPPPSKSSDQWTADDVVGCMPSQIRTYPELGDLNFRDVQINASVTGQGPYPETVFGRGVLMPSIDVLHDTYAFGSTVLDQPDATESRKLAGLHVQLQKVVNDFFQNVREVGDGIRRRQARDIAAFYAQNPNSEAVPETVVFDLITPVKVMNTIQT